jgi:hypothetical protein
MNTERSNSTLNSSPTRSDAPTPTPLNDGTTLPEDVATLKAMIRELIVSLKKEQHEREGVQQRLDLLLRKLYGPKAERFVSLTSLWSHFRANIAELLSDWRMFVTPRIRQ